MLTELEIKQLQFAQSVLWKAMDFVIKEKGYSDFTLYLEGSARDLRDIEEKYTTIGGQNKMEQLIKQVEEWSLAKGLDKADSRSQFLKVTEEVGEVAAALARSDKNALRDGIGDVVVTLIILAQQNDMDLHECLNAAYDEIKGRTGKMVNGVFVKSEDLE